jgi:protein-S-isoprenylcysteine O-methyltransferase Ste14
MSLQARLAVRFALAAPSAWVVLFLPAGSAWFWQGWLFLLFFFAASLFLSIYFLRRDPQLLERRLEVEETVREQKLFKRLWTPLWACALAIPGLDYRFGWSAVPVWLTLVSQAMLLCAYFLIFLVLRVNTYASRVVRVEEEQRVVSSGPYRVVRHPMYSALLILILFTPLALGSYRALPAFALLIPLLIFRLLNEERILRKGLSGYSHYCSRTRFRLVPFLL